MTQVTAIDPYWLGTLINPRGRILLTAYTAELGSVFYSVKEKNFDEKGNRRQADREFSKKAEIETEMARQRQECVSFSFIPWLSMSMLWSAMANVFCSDCAGQPKRRSKNGWRRLRLAEAKRRSSCPAPHDTQALGRVRGLHRLQGGELASEVVSGLSKQAK